MALTLAMFLVVVFCSPLVSCAQRDAKTLAEVEALMSFKINLHDPLGALDGWDSSTPSAPCDWHGVACENSRVTELTLPHLQLGGRLDDRLGELAMLRKLSLRSNFFNGTVPQSLGNCTLLRDVFLQNNSLSGNLPSEIGNLTSLQVLKLARNRLSGDITGELPPSLKYLDFSLNSFSGEILGSVAKLSQLQFINLSYNQFAGQIPARFGELQVLQYLSLDHNLFEGTIPLAIANCLSLMHLSADGNSFSGVIPSALWALPNLQVLMLSHNNLSGSIPGSMLCGDPDFTPSLRIVHLGFNALTYIGNHDTTTCFSVLQVLDLQQNQIRGLFPSMITQIFTLTVVDLSNNLFSGVIPADIGNLFGLEELNIANNSFRGRFPTEIEQCHSLRVLVVQGNHFSGDLFDNPLYVVLTICSGVFIFVFGCCLLCSLLSLVIVHGRTLLKLPSRVLWFVKSCLGKGKQVAESYLGKKKIVPIAEDGGQPV